MAIDQQILNYLLGACFTLFGWVLKEMHQSIKQLQKTDEALSAIQKAVSINPSSIEAQFLLGVSQRRMQKFAEAEKSLKEADKLAKGKAADVHWNLALLYAHNLKKYAEAADHLEQYLKIKPNDTQVESVKKLIKQFRDKAAAGN